MLTLFFAGVLGESARIAGAPCARLPGNLYRDWLLTTNIMYFNLKPKVADRVVTKVRRLSRLRLPRECGSLG